MLVAIAAKPAALNMVLDSICDLAFSMSSTFFFSSTYLDSDNDDSDNDDSDNDDSDNDDSDNDDSDNDDSDSNGDNNDNNDSDNDLNSLRNSSDFALGSVRRGPMIDINVSFVFTDVVIDSRVSRLSDVNRYGLFIFST